MVPHMCIFFFLRNTRHLLRVNSSGILLFYLSIDYHTTCLNSVDEK